MSMIWPEFIPIECEGMSVITAIVFFFLGIGAVFIYQSIQKDIKRVEKRVDSDLEQAVIQTEEKIEDTNSKVDLLFEKIDGTNRDISEIKTRVARTDEAVQWIKKAMEGK